MTISMYQCLRNLNVESHTVKSNLAHFPPLLGGVPPLRRNLRKNAVRARFVSSRSFETIVSLFHFSASSLSEASADQRRG